MAGSFGYQAETAEISGRMGELSLLPRVRSAGAETIVVADGTSCRHQIGEGAGREAVHVARLLRQASDRAVNQEGLDSHEHSCRRPDPAPPAAPRAGRPSAPSSAERRVGKEVVRTGGTRWSPG